MKVLQQEGDVSTGISEETTDGVFEGDQRDWGIPNTTTPTSTAPPPSDFDHQKTEDLIQQIQETLKQELSETKSCIRRVLKEIVGYQKERAATHADYKPLLEKEHQEQQRIDEIESDAKSFNHFAGFNMGL